MKYVIRTAYSIDTNARIEGGPSWLDTEMCDIVGTVPASTSSDQVLKMVQTLLVEQCRLAAHRETRDQAVYAFCHCEGRPQN